MHIGVAIERRVQVARAEGERVDHLARIQLFSGAGDPPGLVELGEAVRHHFGVDAEIAHAALEQERAHGVRHGADPDLQAIPVPDLGGDEPADSDVEVADWRIRQLRCGTVVPFDHEVHFADMEAGLFAMDVGQSPARLDDDGVGALDDGAMPQVGGAQVEVAVLIHRTGLDDDDVRGSHEAPVVVGDLAKIDRNVVATPLVVLLPVVAGEMQAEYVDVFAVGIRVQHGARLHGQTVADLDVRELADAGAERAVEQIGLAQASTVVQPHA